MVNSDDLETLRGLLLQHFPHGYVCGGAEGTKPCQHNMNSPEGWVNHVVEQMSATRSEPKMTERQARAWTDDVVPILERHHIHQTDPDSYNWNIFWGEESRPGRGHSMDAHFSDGEQFVQVMMDVYGYPSVSIATLDWIHADINEELQCDDCPNEDDDED